MMRLATAAAACWAALLAMAPALPAQVSDEAVDESIRRGIANLWSMQAKDGRFEDPRHGDVYLGINYKGAATVMSMLTLAYGGESLQKEEMKKGLKSLTELDVRKTYLVSFRLIALAEIYRRSEAKVREGLRSAIAQDAARLADMQLAGGGWTYEKTQPNEGSFDFSNTQVAVLALSEAAKCGVEVKLDVFLKAQKLYLDRQMPDGGWTYGRQGNASDAVSYGAMTAAGVASLFLTREVLEGAVGCPCRGERSSGLRNPRVDSAIDRGVKWLGDNFTTKENAKNPIWVKEYVLYWLYACERVGIATGYKYLGSHNWYAEGAQAIMARQEAQTGAWGDASETALALLFLIKGRAPMLLNKLRFDGAWDMHPRDAAGLARYVGQAKEQPMNWQVIHLEAPVEEWHEAPILYISAESAGKLSDEHRRKLREFTDSGGTVLFEASCGNPSAAAWWKNTCKAIWPEWELKPLDKDHPLWTADLNLAAKHPGLWGASDGVRTFLLYAPTDISCAWSTIGVARDAAPLNLGCNFYAYTTDRGKLRSRLAKRETTVEQKYAGPALKAGARTQLSVARLKHGGQWYLAENYHPWQLLAADLQQKAGVALKVDDPVQADGEAPKAQMLYYCGRAGSDLGADAAKWLKGYLAVGGFLFAEAAQGDPAFEPALKATLDAAGLTFKPLPADSPLRTGRFGQAAGYNVSRVVFAATLTAERIGKTEPELLGIHDGERLVGVYSPFDIMFSQTGCKAFGNRGYAAEDARALAMNIALYLTGR